jgi:transcriptional regulator with XRE-family HTH domain
MEQDAKPLTPTEVVAARMKALRKKRNLTAAGLAERMKAEGVPWERIVVTKLETGRRASVSVDELLALAKVLNCPLVMLLTARDDDARDYQITSTVTESMGTVRAWMRGQRPLGDADPGDYFGELPRGEFVSVSVTARADVAAAGAVVPPAATEKRNGQDG